MTDLERLPGRGRSPIGHKSSDEIQIGTRSEINRVLAVHWFREVWNERHTQTIDELFPAGAIGHTETGDQGPAEFKARRKGLLNAFPAKRVVGAGLAPARTAADGDHVVVRRRARGTHRANGLGMPPTNRKLDFRGMTLLTFKNGVIVEGWGSWNLGRLLESLR